MLPAELASIENTGCFLNVPGIETKYFALSLRDARLYAALAERAFGDGPFTLATASFPTELIAPEYRVVVDRGIVSVTLPTNLLS